MGGTRIHLPVSTRDNQTLQRQIKYISYAHANFWKVPRILVVATR
jgi:hypothetical protein